LAAAGLEKAGCVHGRVLGVISTNGIHQVWFCRAYPRKGHCLNAQMAWTELSTEPLATADTLWSWNPPASKSQRRTHFYRAVDESLVGFFFSRA